MSATVKSHKEYLTDLIEAYAVAHTTGNRMLCEIVAGVLKEVLDQLTITHEEAEVPGVCVPAPMAVVDTQPVIHPPSPYEAELGMEEPGS